MFAADIELVRRAHATYGLKGPIVDAGGFAQPCVADYQRTIDAVAANGQSDEAQKARYLTIDRPFSFLGDYDIENPESGGKAIEALPADTYETILCMSVLEHTPSPWRITRHLSRALKSDGLLVLSVPFLFPYHDTIDYFRFTPDGLRSLFRDWEILECDWHLRIGAEAGVLDIRTGKPQAIEACYIVARAL